MKRMFLLPFLPLFLLFGCSFEDDSGAGLPEPEPVEEPTPPDDDDDQEADTEAPSAPEDLSTSEVSFEELTLSWKASTDNDEVVKYEVFVDGDAQAEVSTLSTHFTDLAPGQKYIFTVVAVDASGNVSAESDPLEETTLEDTQPPSIPEGLAASALSENSVQLSWEASTDNAGIASYLIHMDEKLLDSTATSEIEVHDLLSGTSYSFSVLAKDIYGNHSEMSAAVEITTDSVPSAPASPLLFFSEYIEGSSYNKALEIVNLSGSDVDLTLFSVKKITNGTGEWGEEKILEGSLPYSEVFVFAHSKANDTIISQADMLLGGGIMNFNGNDMLGLFHNGELIDVIGIPGDEYFAQDLTLQRKASVTGPNTEYTPEEWEVFEMDFIQGLGSY